MRILLVSIILLAVALAAPINDEPAPAQPAGTIPRKEIFLSTARQYGFPQEMIDEYFALGLDNPNNENGPRGVEFRRKWEFVMMEKTIIYNYRTIFRYPEEAIEELQGMGISSADLSPEERQTRIYQWMKKWEHIRIEKQYAAAYRSFGYPEAAIEDLVTMGASRGDITEEDRKILLMQWHKKWEPAVIEKQLANFNRVMGYPEKAIEEFLSLGLARSDISSEERQTHILQWQQKWSSTMVVVRTAQMIESINKAAQEMVKVASNGEFAGQRTATIKDTIKNLQKNDFERKIITQVFDQFYGETEKAYDHLIEEEAKKSKQ